MTAIGSRGPQLAVVVPTLQPAGAERVALTLAGEFSKTARVTIVTFDPRMSRRGLAGTSRLPWADRVPDGCDHVHVPATSSGMRRLTLLALRFAQLAQRRRFDAVYSFLTYTNVVVAMSRFLTRRRFGHVASEHAMADNLRHGGRGLRFLASTLPVVYRFPDHVVVVSDSARHSLRAAGVLPRPERAITIYNPIDVDAVRQLAMQPAGSLELQRLRQHGPVVVSVARLHRQKDHHTLIRAVSLLPREYSLLMVGDGPLRGELDRFAAELGVADRVAFAGAVDNPYPFIQGADVVALSSVEEGFGLVALEAAALGVPFVGSDVGGLSELCAVLGHPRFPPGDAASLAAAIVDVAAHARPAMRSERLERFEVSSVAREYLALAGPLLITAGSDGASKRW